MLKVLIADDLPIFRAALKQILSGEYGAMAVTQGAAKLADFDLASGPWDLAVVTVDAPDRSGLQLADALQRAHPGQRVLALASRTNVSYAERAFKTSVRGVLAKDSTVDELVSAVRKALAGARRAVGKRKGGEWAPAIRAGQTRNGRPSKRELQVLRHFAAGKNVKETASILGVSDSTISTYRARLLRKLHLKNTAGLIGYAFRNGLADEGAYIAGNNEIAPRSAIEMRCV